MRHRLAASSIHHDCEPMNDYNGRPSERSNQDDAGRTGRRGSSQEAGGEGIPLTAYTLPGMEAEAVPIVPASAGRAWMRETYKGYAHRCLPMLIANQSGWFLLNNAPLRVVWDGRTSINALQIEYEEERPAKPLVSSIFGYGILTWRVDYLFRTPPGYNLSVRGPVNMPKDGIHALDGVVETDWAVASFTMNWKLTRPNHPVTFEAGEPFCMIAPCRRHELEAFEPRITDRAEPRARGAVESVPQPTCADVRGATHCSE